MRARDFVDHECEYNKTSEEIYQDLCVDRPPMEVFKILGVSELLHHTFIDVM